MKKCKFTGKCKDSIIVAYPKAIFFSYAEVNYAGDGFFTDIFHLMQVVANSRNKIETI